MGENIVTSENNDALVIHNSIEIFKSAPQILQANQLRTQKAISVGNSILTEWQNAWAIADEEQQMIALAAIDLRSNNFLVNCNAALTEEKEARAAITQMMDNFRSMFTTAENEIDKAKDGTVPKKVQLQRNSFATKTHDIAERKRKIAEDKAAKDKESIDIKYQMENSYANQFNTYLLERKKKMMAGFNAITLETFEEKSEKLKRLTFSFQFKPEGLYASNVKYHSNEDLKGFSDWAIHEGEENYTASFMAEMELHKDDLIEKLPSKKNELEEAKRIADKAEADRIEANRIAEDNRKKLEKANEEDRAELEAKQKMDKEIEDKRLADLKEEQDKTEAERKQREDDDNARLLAESNKAIANAALATDIKKQGDETMSLFEKEAAIAEVNTDSESKQTYEIQVTHAVGWTQIFQLWFQTEGQNLTIDKIGNTKLDQMKAWAEKHYLKTSTKIESKFLNYKAVLKAVNKK
jgi:hypothetical protein